MPGDLAIREALEAFGIHPTANAWETTIEALYEDLERAADGLNLTRIRGRSEVLVKHVLDSLLGAAAFPRLATKTLRIADVGCGAGFPGLPLAICFPALEAVEIDSTRKKSAYTAGAIERLRIANARAVWGRARELARTAGHQGQYDLVVTRAVGPTPRVIRECRRLARPDGGILAYSTPAAIDAEHKETIREAGKAGLKAVASPIFQLPGDAGARRFWILTAADG